MHVEIEGGGGGWHSSKNIVVTRRECDDMPYLTVPNVSSPARSATSVTTARTRSRVSRLARNPTLRAALVTSNSYVFRGRKRRRYVVDWRVGHIF